MLLINLLLWLFTISQEYDQQNYLNYHNQIIQAEKLIANYEFEEALKVYEQIFNSYDFVFLK